MAKRTKADCYDAFIEEVTAPWTPFNMGYMTRGGVVLDLEDISRNGDCKIDLVSIRGRGAAVVAALRRVTSVADKHDVTLTLDALPLPAWGEKLKPVRYLEALYKKFGFEPQTRDLSDSPTAWQFYDGPRGRFDPPDTWERWAEQYEARHGFYPSQEEFDQDEWGEIQEEFYEWAVENSDEEWRLWPGSLDFDDGSGPWAQYLASIPMVRKPAKKRRRRR